VLPPELDEPPPELDELPPEEEPAPELDELPPPELDEPPHVPATALSQPCPQIGDEAQPSCGLWHANPAPPSGYVQPYMNQFVGQHDGPPELDDVAPELEEPAPELDE
jgi:hypothetical protein